MGNWFTNIIKTVGDILKPSSVVDSAGQSVAAATSSVGAVFSEVSGIAKVDGGWILGSDEKTIGLWFTRSLTDFSRATRVSWKNMPSMDDVESMFMRGVTLWIVCSGSTTKSGKDDESRRLIVAVDYPMDDSRRKVHVYKYLRETISQATNAGPTSVMLKNSVGKSPEIGGYDIEGGCVIPNSAVPGTDLTLLGFRSPLIDRMTGDALVAQIQFPERLFDHQDRPCTASEIGLSFYALRLGGFGVRDMYYDQVIGKMLVVAGPVGDADGSPFRLYLFDPATRQASKVVEIPSKINKDSFHPEAVTRDGARIVVVGDSASFPPPTWTVPV